MIGDVIHNLRISSSMTQSELGERMDVIKQTVSNWEKNISTPNIDAIIKLSKIFNVSTDYLLGKSENKGEPQEQSEPVCTTITEQRLLKIHHTYLNQGITSDVRAELESLFPELREGRDLSSSEKKILRTFHNLNEDNQDIIIGKAKELLREQNLSDASSSTGAILKEAN